MKHYFLIKVLLYKALIYFQDRSNVISIPETQGPWTPRKKTKNDLNFKENYKTAQSWNYNLKNSRTTLRSETFATRKFRKLKQSQNFGILQT